MYSTRPGEIFRGFSALWFLKYLGQFLSALAILGHSERFSPGKIRSEVGRPGGLFKAIGGPTSELILPGENLSEWPEIAKALMNWPKYFKNHRAKNAQKILRGLLFHQFLFSQVYLVSVQKNKVKASCFWSALGSRAECLNDGVLVPQFWKQC